ncbi:MAG: iron ABC transporter permease [Candidatus Rokubacteria bacterium]|nr:iron ABC transporter permease [Candidatus Rokubacteria bacterium]
MRGAGVGALVPLVPVAAVMGGAVCYPALVLVWYGLSRDQVPTLANLGAVLADGDTWRVLANTLYVAAATTVLGGALGTVLALLVARTDLPGRALFQGVLILPYLVPPFIGAMAWLYVLGPTGLVNQAWMALSGSPDPLLGIYGSGGIVLAMTLYKYPIAYLTVLAGLERVDPALEEAARSAGASPWRMARDVTLPLVAPSIAAGMTLVFLSAMAEFGTPAILGFPAKYFVLATKIYRTVLDFDRPYNLHVAAALSLLLVAVAGGVLALQRWWFGERGFGVMGGPARAPVVPLGRARRWLGAGVTLFVLLTSALPLGAVLLTALTRAYGRPLGLDNLGLENFRLILFHLPAVWRATRNSLVLAACAATVCVILALAVAYLQQRARLRGSGVLETLVTLPFAVPGTVLALAIVLAFLRPVFGLRLYNTLWIILIAYVARFLALALRPVGAALLQLHPALEEAARASGASLWRSLADVTVPLLRGALLAAWLLAAVPALTELTLSVILWSAGNETIGVMAFNLHEEGKVLLSAALASLIVAVSLGAHVLTRYLAAPTLRDA